MNINLEKIKGLKISTINKVLIVATCILAAVLFVVTLFAARNYEEMSRLSHEYIRMEEQASIVEEASDYLTNAAHEFVITGRLEYVERYFEEANVTKRREHALNELSKQENVSYEDVQAAVDESKRLMNREFYAMKLAALGHGYDVEGMPAEIRDVVLDEAELALTATGKLDLARQMLHDGIYHDAKDRIYKELDTFTNKVLKGLELRIENGRTTLGNSIFLTRIVLLVLVCLNVLIAVVLTCLVLKPLNRFLVNIREKKMLKETGTYEFRHLAQVYNTIYTEKAESDHQKAMFQYKAEHDLMTGLLNRISAEEQVRKLIDFKDNDGVLILLDLDDLKGINDTFGHDEGDKAILGIAETLKGHFNDRDIIGRLGGDEFLIYLPGAARQCDSVTLQLTSLLRKLAGIAVGGEEDHRIHCSIGCAVQKPLSGSFEVLFKEADTALYQVKRSGKNQFAFYTPEMEQADYQFQKELFLKDKNIRKFATEELQEILDSIADFYQLVLSANLSKNNYYIMDAEVEGVFSQMPVFGSLEQFMGLTGEEVLEEDRQEFFARFSREALLQAYQKGRKNMRHHFRFRQPEGYRWVECNVILYMNESGDICNFAMLRWADECAN